MVHTSGSAVNPSVAAMVPEFFTPSSRIEWQGSRPPALRLAMTSRLIHRHDQFFKRLLDKPGAAGALLRERLPEPIACRLSADTPELVAGSFISESLREYRTDRLYRVRMIGGQTAFIHVVIEHKSAPDPRIGLQLLGYLAQIWQWWDDHEDRAADGRRRPLPPVFPLVVYHGAADWAIPTSFAETLAADAELRPYLLDFRYGLMDLGRIEDRALSREQVLQVGLMILKRGSRDGDLRAILLELGRSAAALGFGELIALVRYIVGEPNDLETAILRDVLKEIIPGQEAVVMSIAAEQFKAEGRAEGIALGRTEGKAEMLLRLLRRRFGAVDERILARVRTADACNLEIWYDRLLDAESLDGVFGADSSH
jgi:hypothetical protein